MNNEEFIKRIVERERSARKEAERIMEEKSRELYKANVRLQELNTSLEKEVIERTEAIRRSEEQLRLLFEKHPMPMLVYRQHDLQILAVNQTAIDCYGYTREEFLEMNIRHIHPEGKISEDVLLDEKNVSTVFSTRDMRHITKNGNIIDVRITSTPLEFNEENCRMVVIIDITERKKAQKELELKEKSYRELVESVSDIIYRCNINGFFTYVNPTTVYLSGYSEKELLSMHFSDLIRKDYRPKVARHYSKQFHYRIETSYLEFPVITKSGEEMWVGQTVDIHYSKENKNKLEFIALARNITDKIRAQEALVRSEEKYRNMIENLELGLLEVDNYDRITKAHDRFCDLTGYSNEELLGKKVIETLLPEEFRGIMRQQNKNRLKGQSGVYEVQLVRKDGKRIWVIISGAPFYDQFGRIAGSLGIHLDITERKQMENDLRIAKEVAENSVKMKELFMANMSHEIRTPMNVIIGMSELLQKTAVNKEQHDYLRAIRQSADNLLVIINDILDFSKIESGKLQLEYIPVDMKDFIITMGKIIELKAEEKGLKLVCNSDNFDCFYMADPTRLNQVIINLLGNAVKFTDYGSVELSCKILKKSDIHDTLFFSVKDTGVGIANDKCKKIFESFMQADESTARKYGGTGLGLPISKRLVELMGGELEVISEPGKGSEFYFSLQLEKSGAENKKDKTKNELVMRLPDGVKVLLVEDHEMNRLLAQVVLENWKCCVDVAVDGKQAVEKVEQNNYDIVLMDMRMPELDGVQATSIIRNKLKSKVPIIALTANAIKGDKEKCIESGMNDYVSKPIKQEELLNKMLKQIPADKIVYINKETAGANASAEKRPESFIDLSKLKNIAGNNKDFMKQMISFFIKDAPLHVDRMKAAINKKDLETLKNLAHKLKPSIDYLACLSMQREIRLIEKGRDLPDEILKQANLFCSNTQKLVKQLEKELETN